jgi:NTE family protein
VNFSGTWENLTKLWEKTRLPQEGISLALGGGAVLGAAHIGVLKALDENSIKISAISGTSIGALIASLYAFGKKPSQIEEFIAELEWLDVSGFTLSKYGILSNEDLGKYVTKYIGAVDFSEAGIPLHLIATDLSEGKKIILNTGRVSEAIMASTCIPGIFVPVEIDDRLLVDGGLVENVPVSPLRDSGCNFIVGVDLNAGRQYQRPKDIIDVFVNAIDIAIDNVTRSQTTEADLVIAPELGSYSRRDTSRISELINEGYEGTCKLIVKLKSRGV